MKANFKLIKKLLPILSATSVATIVAPIVTSCAKDDLAFAEWDFTKGPWHGSVPTKGGFLECTFKKGLEIYLEDCKNNMKIMAEDLVTSASTSNVTVDARITYFGGRVNDINKDDSRLSLTATYNRWVQDETLGSLFKVTTVEIKNLKYRMMSYNDQYGPIYFDNDPILSPTVLYDEYGNVASDEKALAAMVSDKEWSVNIHEEAWSGSREVQKVDYEFNSDYASQIEPNTDEAAHLFFRINNVSFEASYMRAVSFIQEN